MCRSRTLRSRLVAGVAVGGGQLFLLGTQVALIGGLAVLPTALILATPAGLVAVGSPLYVTVGDDLILLG
jgi:hypothetical protein